MVKKKRYSLPWPVGTAKAGCKKTEKGLSVDQGEEPVFTDLLQCLSL